MANVAVPVQDEREVDWAVEQAVKLFRFHQARIHLLNVQHPLPRHVSRFFSGADLQEFHQESGMRVLQPAIRKLTEAEVAFKVHLLVGHEAETIVHFAEEYGCTRIVMEDKPEGLLSALGLGAVNSQVSHLLSARNLSVAMGAVQI
ncbi:MAG TPA: universal stress protein [Burkholderiales bacterium]|jgi:nucleotide-binding universal stress UspA family protein